MKLILQSEATECGLASLAMEAQHHGHKIDLNAMRQRFGSSLMGVRLRDLMKISGQLMLASRAMRLEPERLIVVYNIKYILFDICREEV